MEKMYLSWQDVESILVKMSLECLLKDFKPNIVFGLVRGGSISSVILSHLMNIHCSQIHLSLRDTKNSELLKLTNNSIIMENLILDRMPFLLRDQKLLFVDDINDSGETLATLNNYLFSLCWNQFGWDKEEFDSVWARNVRTGVLVNNLSSKFDVDFYGKEINKAERDVWVVFPWENVNNIK